jgi:ABC transport system ATP-binding/permease protein
MSDKILKALLQLFAILGKAKEGVGDSRQTVYFFLKQILNSEQVEDYIKIYNEFLLSHENKNEGEKQRKKTSVSSVKILVICEQINEALTQRQKIVVLVRLIEVILEDGNVTEQEIEFISTVASSLNISDDEYDLLYRFCAQPDFVEHEQLLTIVSKKKAKQNTGKILHCEGLQGEIRIVNVKSTGMYFLRYYGGMAITHNGQNISDLRIYQLNHGSSIRGSKIETIYYSDIVGSFLNEQFNNPLQYVVDKITYHFPDGEIGLHELSFEENSGKLIGIMGGSGAGKSTLLNILNGSEIPDTGNVFINGYDLHREKKNLEGVIGFVSQDDLLIDDLSVFQNLYFNAQLCFSGKDNTFILRKVHQTLHDLGLFDIKDLRVGSPLDKTISGGQRKRLNIALELIREPGILFVDEPTSGLSSRDSETIIDLLKELALKGKLVFVVIHQPSSDIFKVFDKLLILDKGGYPIYLGNPVESIAHFKTAVNYVNPEDNECGICGNVNPEQVFNIIETRVLDENGQPTTKRKVSPKEWNKLFLQSSKNTEQKTVSKSAFEINYKKPGFFQQMKIFILRDVLAKFSNKQYLIITLLEAPLLAFILSYMTRFNKSGNEYAFSDNKNMVAYFFMSVVVALFLGLTVSAEEIFRDRKIRKREEFLNLSKASYLFSKTSILLVISALQTALFVIIGNSIAGIAELNFHYWLVLFAVSFFANILGLNISSAFKSAVTIYILIPFLIIPQLLLSGVLVKYDELNPGISAQSVVPLAGDVMVSRWAIEALAVERFTKNAYEKDLYPFEKAIVISSFVKGAWVNKMKELISAPVSSASENEIIANEWKKMFPFRNAPNVGDAGTKSAMLLALDTIKTNYNNTYKEAAKKRDEFFVQFQKNPEQEKYFTALKKNYHNEKIAEIVKNPGIHEENILIEKGELHPVENNIYFDGSPLQNIRAHFYAPTKSFMGKRYDTFTINLFVILFMTIIAWVALYFEWLKNTMDYFENFSKNIKRKATEK